MHPHNQATVRSHPPAHHRKGGHPKSSSPSKIDPAASCQLHLDPRPVDPAGAVENPRVSPRALDNASGVAHRPHRPYHQLYLKKRSRQKRKTPAPYITSREPRISGGNATEKPGSHTRENPQFGYAVAPGSNVGPTVRRLRLWLCPRSSTTPDGACPGRRFRITHPFHPLHGREYELVSYRQAWGEHRIYFHEESGRLVLIPAAWTDAVAGDPFVEIAAGRSHFRLVDLLRLVDLVARLGARPERRRSGL